MLLPRSPAVLEPLDPLLEPLDLLPPPGRGRAAPAPGRGHPPRRSRGRRRREVRGQVSWAEGERGQGLDGGDRMVDGSGDRGRRKKPRVADLQQFNT